MRLDDVLDWYRTGVFPMGRSRDDPTTYLHDPEFRGIIPLDAFHIPRRLARTVRQDHYRVSVDEAFVEVLAGCAGLESEREGSWINPPIFRIVTALHEAGHAHSLEAWDGDDLVGGLYGVRLGAAFFGESMFSVARDASKVALVHLVARLRIGGFTLLDAQFTNAHLQQFGVIEIPREDYHARLAAALNRPADFLAAPRQLTGAAALQATSQAS
jgi:leucyl/phenylalanyl-tRNA---protein transferase